MDRKGVKVSDRVLVLRHTEPYIGIVWQKHTKTCNVYVRSLHSSLRVPYGNLSVMEDSEIRYITNLPLEKLEWSSHLRIIEGMARDILKEHGLQHWSFQFDWSHTRAGVCMLDLQTISVSVRHCMKSTLAEVRNTILHEVAHAIAGPRHHHDAVWYEIALRIGCTAKRTHNLKFADPKYIRRCPQNHWVATGQKRMRHRICRTCRQEVVYETYNEQRYKELQQVCRKSD